MDAFTKRMTLRLARDVHDPLKKDPSIKAPELVDPASEISKKKRTYEEAFGHPFNADSL